MGAHFSDRKFEPQPELEQPKCYPHIVPADDTPMIDDSVTEYREVENSVKKLKNAKCQGTDNICAEQLKYSQSIGLISYIVLLIGLIRTCSQVPVKWLTVSITCLHKKGRKSLAENYRGLSIIATVSKVLFVIVMERIREVYEHILMPSAVWLPSKQTIHWRYICITLTTRECKEIKETPVYSIWGLKASYDWIRGMPYLNI